MSGIKEAITRFLRGPAISTLLKSLGIDARRYWLLMDLFGQLSERREMLSQLGRDGVTLKIAALLYFGLAALCSVVMVAAGMPLATYFPMFLGITAFLLLTVLLSETGNSLVNPVEGLVLAHQPINGATYTAAKLTHLLRIVVYLAGGLNAVPALAGLMLKDAGWLYPLIHMLAAFALGLLAALLCCAVFGWLIRFVPAPRLKAAGQIAELMPWMVVVFSQYGRNSWARLHVADWFPAETVPLRYLFPALGVVSVAIVILGIRSLSGDYLIRVASIIRGGSAAKAKVRRSRIGEAIALLFGGQASRAGFEYVSRMMVRDWQFRRQMIPMIPALIAPAALLAHGYETSPFSSRFTGIHGLPHVFGILLFWICSLLPYGSDHKGAWIFLLAPNRAFGGFACGIYALLWIDIVVIPHVIMLLVLPWFWGIWHAVLFVAYSVAVASAYLGLELRLIEGVPFGTRPEASRAPMVMPLVMMGGFGIAIAVALQYFVVFRSPAMVMSTTIVIAIVAYFLTRSSLRVFEVSIRYNLGLLSGESTVLYKEVDV